MLWPPEDPFNELFWMVGYIVVRWGSIEQDMDGLITIVYNLPGGRELAQEKQLPRMFKRKVRFLKTAFSQLTLLQPYKQEMDRLLETLQACADIRHWLVHGAITGDYTELSFGYAKIEYGKDEYTLSTDELLKEYFPILRDKFHDLLVESGNFLLKLSSEFPTRPRSPQRLH
jgi:hypothetical protein